MTQQILPKATLTSALRRCHSMELKTHRGPWYYSVLLATISVFFFLEQSPFPLKPLFVAFEWSKQNTNIWKWKHTSFSRITVGSDRNSVDKMREASICSSEFQLCCLLNMWEHTWSLKTTVEEWCFQDCSLTDPIVALCCQVLYEVTLRHHGSIFHSASRGLGFVPLATDLTNTVDYRYLMLFNRTCTFADLYLNVFELVPVEPSVAEKQQLTNSQQQAVVSCVH